MPDPSSHEHEHGPQAGKEVAYEHSDVNIGAIIKFGVVLTAGGVLVHLIILAMNGILIQKVEKSQPKLSPLVKEEQVKLPRDLTKFPVKVGGEPAGPRLQLTEHLDLQALQDNQRQKLEGYGWVDEKKGVVHIPIDEAMKILADPKQQAKHGIHVKDGK